MRMIDGSSDVCSSDVPDRRHVAERRNVETNGLQRTERRFTTGAGAFDFDFQRADAMFGGLLARVFGANLRRIGSRLAAALETHHAGARPGNRIALRVGDGDPRVVEGRVDVGDARRDILAFAPTRASRLTSNDENINTKT